jgi:iron complex transport system substrate-binding protein
VRRRDLFGLGAGAIVGFAFARPSAEAKAFTDSAGRRIEVYEIRRVFPAGPPASVALFAVAPEKMLGWTRAPSPEARPFLPARYAELPEIGRLTGRGNTVNLENVVRLMPDLVLDVGSTTDTYVSLADQVQEQTHIPAVLVGESLAETAATLRTVGTLLGVPEQAETLAYYAETVLDSVHQAVAKIPMSERPSVYVARGPRGLETAVAGSIGSEVVDLVGARNVVNKDTAPRAIADVSSEQVLAPATGRDPDRRPTIFRHGSERSDLARGQSGASGARSFRSLSSVLVAGQPAGTQSADRPPMAR